MKSAWIFQIAAAAVMLFAGLSKFFMSGPEQIFLTLGMGLFGMYLIGSLEVISGVLILISRSASSGAIISLGVLIGAIIAHLTVLGLNDPLQGGLLVAGTLASSVVLYVKRKEVPFIGKTL